MMRNYLKGTQGDQINALMAAVAFNFRRLLRKYEKDFHLCFFETVQLLFPKLNNRFFWLKIGCLGSTTLTMVF
jgi:hypothetical protein